LVEVSGQQRENGLDAPSALDVDGSYVSSEALKNALNEGRELRGPAPASPDRGKVFTSEVFDVHVEERYATCPGGQRSSNCSRLEDLRSRPRARCPIVVRGYGLRQARYRGKDKVRL